MAIKTHIVIYRVWPPDLHQFAVSWTETDTWTRQPRAPRLTAPLQAKTYTEAVEEAARVLCLSPKQVG